MTGDYPHFAIIAHSLLTFNVDSTVNIVRCAVVPAFETHPFNKWLYFKTFHQ